MNKLRGALIVFEGCDKSGKSTQCAKLAAQLVKDGHSVELLKFPDRTTAIGKMIDNYLKQTQELDDHTVHLLFSANRWEAFQSMKNSLKAGTTLIVDRYAYSGVAFTAAKGLDLEWCRTPDKGLLKPDLVLYLTVNDEIAAQRGDYGGERYEKREFQKRVGDIFMDMRDKSYWEVVDGNNSISAIHDIIYNKALKSIADAQESDLSLLWTKGQSANV